MDDLFGASEPVHSADDLARAGVFDDGEVEEFLALALHGAGSLEDPR
jgi:hypothetical protein